MPRLRALIVGCGRIAGGFDSAETRSGEFPLTHAGGYTRDARFEIAGCVEPDDDRRLAFMSRWKVPAGYRTIEEARSAGGGFDVVSVCSPTHCHAHDLEVALEIGPRLLFCEKPVAESAAHTTRLVAACEESGIPLAVNYTRRWDPSVSELKQAMEEGRFGPLRSVVAYYNKGLLNNGSHMLDLVQSLLGPLRVVDTGRPVDDHTPQDPSVPAWLETATGLPVLLACGHAADYALFELQLVFANALVTMEEGGLFWRDRKVVASRTFSGYRVPDEGRRRTGGYLRAMSNAVDNIFAAITHGRALASTGETALATHRLCEDIRR
jgi:predicted dehydrogenase